MARSRTATTLGVASLPAPGWAASRRLPLPLVALLLLAACSRGAAQRPRPTATVMAVTRPSVVTASMTPAGAIPAPHASATSTPAPLDSTNVPPADPFALARRLLHIDAPHTVNSTPPVYHLGQQQRFWIEDIAATRATTVNAVLRAFGQHAYLYVQTGLDVSDGQVADAIHAFDTIVYPLDTRDVGPPPLPGIDDDPRITILVADLHGAGGYFTQLDDEPRAIARTSNERKLIYIDAGSATPGTLTFDGYLAHEFQHLVHFNRNPTAQTWINEGMSELMRAQVTHALLNIPRYEAQPDTQLNDWPTLGEGSSLPYYGAAQSFLRYLLQHYGGIEQAGMLAAEPGDGIAEVRAYLAQGGSGVSFERVFEDWLAADLINDPAGGRYSQNDTTFGTPRLLPVAVPSRIDATVHQFGANYYAIAPGGQALTVTFHGAGGVAALPTTSPSGAGLWWSRRGDSIDSTLTRAVDLRAVARATLQFETWYDIERDYDYAYVEASRDNGRTWTALRATHSTSDNPFGIALGPGYSGQSGGWLDESVDLSPFAGKQILLRFEYVTDEAGNRNGWALAAIRIPAIGYTDRGAAHSGWTEAGFERLIEPLPQRFLVEAVLTDAGQTRVQRLSLDANNRATLTLPAGTSRAVVIVSGATDLIRTPARYRLGIH